MSTDYYEGRIATLRTGIKMAAAGLEPSPVLSDRKLADVAIASLNALLGSDLDRGLAHDRQEANDG